MPTASMILPFAVPAKERVKAFTPNMELSAVLFLSEAKRKKRGLLETTPKKTSFVSKLHYPLWAAPWENKSLIIDGLSALSSTIEWQALPDITIFIDDIEHGKSVREQFWNTLEKHEKTYGNFAKIEEAQVNAIITDTEFLNAIFEYTTEAFSLNHKENPTVVLVPPKLDQQAAVESARQVSNLHKRALSEIRALEYARNLLDETAKLHEQMILKEAESVRENFETEISKVRPAVDKRISQIAKERDSRLGKMGRIIENELRSKERERERREHELQRLELSRTDYVKRLAARKRRKDKIGAAHWEHRTRVYENKIEELKKRIRALSDFIEKTRRQNESGTEKLKYGYQALMDQEQKKILSIEIQRDKNIEAKQMEIARLKLATSRIIGQIEALIEQKREQEAKLKELSLPLQFEDATLLCLPFYLACYEGARKTQFQVFPPFRVMNSEGIVKTLQKTISSLRPGSRINLLLQPRSKAISQMLNFVVEEKAKSDKTFGESLLQAASSCNVLDGQNFKETLVKGVDDLKAEGWISQSQGNALIKTYT